MKTINAADANRQFSSLLREVAQGEEITVLSRGRPVASIRPVGEDEGRRTKARAVLIERLKAQAPTGARNWARDELYD